MATNDGNMHLWDGNNVPFVRAFFMLISIEFASRKPETAGKLHKYNYKLHKYNYDIEIIVVRMLE